ncbi:ribonuclease H-like domain-containing protein [Mycena pura]|uniref:Ribonuclease H-like domain-containing protein n=1 Tax=Mycena pura TaxID=153505 RepID=A0AAD6VV62_9AGAR|nr:ribonuclease H-like domain-containing protein [Mycena pura]
MAPPDLQQLKDAAAGFIREKNADIMKIEKLMDAIFGDYASRQENPIAKAWSLYFSALVAYDEQIDAGEKMPGGDDNNLRLPPPVKLLLIPPVSTPTSSASQPKRKKADAAADLDSEAELSDSEPAAKRRAGRQAIPLLDRLSIPGHNPRKATKNKHFWTCIAPDCPLERQGRRTEKDVLKHASECNKLRTHDLDAWQAARDAHSGAALGAMLGVASADSADLETVSDSASTAPRPIGRPPKLLTLESGQQRLNVPAYYEAGREQIAGQNEAWMNGVRHWIMRLICQCGMVPDMLERDEWNAFMKHMNPTYQPISKRDMTNIISKEATLVDELTVKALTKHQDNTITFDGTQNRRGDEMYTQHACTPDRKVFFLGASIGTTESRNAEWIEKGLIQTIETTGRERFAATCSDSTNVTLATRRDLATEIPAMLDICDVVHALQHIIGDINELPAFKNMLHTMKPLIRHFSKSGSSKAHLREASASAVGDGGDRLKMLAKIGKTRFATHLLAVQTLEPALADVCKLYRAGKINFSSKTVQALFDGLPMLGSDYSLEYVTFRRDLLIYQAIVTPFARALWALESTTANASDAFLFWTAIPHALDTLFAQPSAQTGIELPLQQNVRAIYNDRHKFFFAHSELYFVGFCLDPRYKNPDFLRKRLDAPDAPVPEGILFPHAFLRVKTFLKKLLLDLINAHKAHVTGEGELAVRLQKQLVAFWSSEAPFHADLIDGDIMEWLRNLALGGSARCDVLVMLLQRVFSILVNSMPDERTNSMITWLNSPLRGNQNAQTLINMIKVGQWYTYHAPNASGPRRPPRPPTVPFRRIPDAAIKATQMVESQSDDSEEEDSDSEDESDDQSEREIDTAKERELEALRKKVMQRKKLRGKKGMRKTFRADSQFVVDIDVTLDSRGLKWLLMNEEEYRKATEKERADIRGKAATPAVVEKTTTASHWDW